MGINLREKFHGCIAGAHIGSAMGAATKGMDWREIKDRYGFVDEFHEYERNGRVWAPGSTQADVERQKLILQSIIDKGGRVKAEDIRSAWLNYANPQALSYILEPYEGDLMTLAKTPIPAKDIGKYCDYSGLAGFAGACQPIGLINAGNIETARLDILEAGQLYQAANSRGLQWACVTGIAIAAATWPDATVDSVIGAVYDNCDPELVVQEIEKHLVATMHIEDGFELRSYFDNVYKGSGVPYAFASTNEVVTKAICIFQMVKGNTKQAVLTGVNMGRGTDCIATIAAGITGAYGGAESIPQEWIRQLDAQTLSNPYTCSKRTIQEWSDTVYKAFQNRLRKQKVFVEEMGA